MSSSTFVITVIDRPKPNWSIWRVRNTTAGGANDYVNTRSFVLDAISPHSNEISKEIGNDADLTSESWYEQNIERFIEYVTFFAEVNIQPNDQWPNNADELINFEYESESVRENKLCEVFHHVYLAIEFTNASFIDDLPDVFETNAFDWWFSDPTREPMSYCVEDFNSGKLDKLENELATFMEDIRTSKYP